MIKMSRRGFTLIELLIAMAILAVLSALGFANFQSTRIKAQDAKRKSDLSTIAKSLEAYVNDHRSYPQDNGGGQIVCQTGVTCAWGTTFTDGTTTYAAPLPADNGGHSYYYTSTGTSFSLYATLDNPNDSSIQSISGVYCGGTTPCNYKITSSNIE